MKKILLVDDEDTFLMLLKMGLTDQGFDVITARGAIEALEIVKADPEAIGLVLSDIRLGNGVDGVQVARIMRDALPEIPVVLMSGGNRYSFAQLAEATPHPVLSKPFDLTGLGDRLRIVQKKHAELVQPILQEA
jgi:DNA-binding NtrC family response regulator